MCVLEPAAHGMGAPQAFQNGLQNANSETRFGLKMVSIRHFGTSNRNGKKRVRSYKTIQCHNVEKISKFSNVSIFFYLASKNQAIYIRGHL